MNLPFVFTVRCFACRRPMLSFGRDECQALCRRCQPGGRR